MRRGGEAAIQGGAAAFALRGERCARDARGGLVGVGHPQGAAPDAICLQRGDQPIADRSLGHAVGRNPAADDAMTGASYQKQAASRPDERAARALRSAVLWADPAYRAKNLAGRGKRTISEALRAKLREKAQARWQDPAYRAKLEAVLADPVAKARRVAALNKRWDDPAKRAAHAQKVSVARHRRRTGLDPAIEVPKWVINARLIADFCDIAAQSDEFEASARCRRMLRERSC